MEEGPKYTMYNLWIFIKRSLVVFSHVVSLWESGYLCCLYIYLECHTLQTKSIQQKKEKNMYIPQIFSHTVISIVY